MRRIEINNDGNPLGKFGDGDFNPNCYPDAVYMVNNLLEVIQVFVRELACSSKDGTITIDKIGNRMVLLAPDDPTAGFEIGEIGPRIYGADQAVRDAERHAGLCCDPHPLGGMLSGGVALCDNHTSPNLDTAGRDLGASS